MIRFILRIIAMIFLAIAVMYGVLDLARSIADAMPTLTTLGESAGLLAPEAISLLQNRVNAGDHSFLSADMLATLLGFPICVLALVLAILFYLASSRSNRRKGRFSLE